MNIQFCGLPTEDVRQIRQSGLDANHLAVERHVSEGNAWPCRHCLGETPRGQIFLILAYRPFSAPQPYAETGPIFLCEEDCAAYSPSEQVPSILRSNEYLVRGYDERERIVYGTGQVVPTREIPGHAERLLANAEISFVDVRSASNNCFQCRVVRKS